MHRFPGIQEQETLGKIPRYRIGGNRLAQLYQIMLNHLPRRLQHILPLTKYESTHSQMLTVIS